MSQVRSSHRAVKTLAEALAAIPVEFSDILGNEGGLLPGISLIGDHPEVRPLRPEKEEFWRHTHGEV